MPATLPPGGMAYEDGVGLVQEDMVQELSRKVNYFWCMVGSVAHERKGKVGKFHYGGPEVLEQRIWVLLDIRPKTIKQF